MVGNENRRMAHDIIEYKKSATFKNKILKTVCAFANNYMNREIGLLFIGIEEVDDTSTGEKAVPKRPITGIEETLKKNMSYCVNLLMMYLAPI